MARLVMKFGGTSVADVDRIRNVARHVEREIKAGHSIAVVVSAMSGKTNELVSWCKDASIHYDEPILARSSPPGRRVTAGLLAIALQERGLAARSWLGWQIPILTSGAHGAARIVDVDGTSQFSPASQTATRSPSSRDFKASPKTSASRRSGAAGRIRRLSRLPSRSRPTVAISTPTSTAFIRPIRASSKKRPK